MDVVPRLTQLNAKLDRVIAFNEGDELHNHMRKYPAFWNSNWPEKSDREFLKKSTRIPFRQVMNESTKAIRASGARDLLRARSQGLR